MTDRISNIVQKALIIISFVICANSLIYSQTISVSYTYGKGATDPNFNANGNYSNCPLSLVVNIPNNASITGVDIIYQMTATGNGKKQDQRSRLKCVSPGGTSETQVFEGSGESTGTQTYNRQNLSIANNITNGGNIVFELHAGKDSLSDNCSIDDNYVDNNWTITVHYHLTPNCNSTPFGGIAVSSMNLGCAGISSEIELSSSGYSSNMNGLNYQWQKCSDGSNWSNMSGESNPNSANYTTTSSTQFRLAVTCSYTSETGYSNVVDFTVEPCNGYIIGGANSTVYTDNALFYDSGGPGNYSNNESKSITFCSESGDHLRADFITFNTEDNGESGRYQERYDNLKVWDGGSTGAFQMFEFSGIQSGNNIVPIVISSGSCLSFSFSSDESTVRAGWLAHISTTTENPYVASQYCETAPHICDLNGYIGSTSNFYNLERVHDQIQHESELYPGSAELDNNSFIKFTASNSTVIFGITVSNCSDSFYGDPGLQFAVYKGSSCYSFELVSSPSYIDPGLSEGYHEIVLNNLNVGQTYYLMTDGSFGAICHYSISADSGIEFATVSPGSSSICEGEAATFTASGGSDYSWVGPDGFYSSNSSITVDEEGIYTVTVSGGIEGCPTNTVMSTSLEVIGDYITPEFSLPNEYCKGDNIPSLPNTSDNGITGIWNPPLNNQATTTYHFTSVSEQCITPTSITIKLSPDYTIEPNEPNCFGESGTIDIIENGENLPYSYIFNGSSVSPPFTATSGEHQIIVSDNALCIDTSLFYFEQPEKLEIDYLLTDRTCFGEIDADITMNASGGTAPYTYCLLTEGTNINGQTHENLNHSNYILMVTDSKNCIEQKDLLLAEPAQLLASYVSYNPSCFGNNDGFVEFFIEGGTEPYFLIYDQDTFKTAIINNLEDGLYDFTIVDTNQCAIDIKQINLINPDIECIKIPNAFTPNNDGINDQWIIENLHLYENAVVRIYNRWGQEVHYGDYTDKWDGKCNNMPVPSGPYVYILDLHDGTPSYVGTITVVY